MESRHMFLEELALALRDAENPQALVQTYSIRQQRLEAMAASVVTIQACGGMGSGVILDSSGYIATNAHVVSTGNSLCNSIIVSTAWGWQGAAQFIAGEYEQDVAIIKVRAEAGFQGVVIAPEIFLGQDVFAVGHPLGRSHTVTRGIISYPSRMIDERPYIQTDASINPGNSGGGLFDELGRLVGLPTFKEVWADSSKTIPVANIGFAVPGEAVQHYYMQAFQRDLAMECSGNPESVRRPVFLS